MVICVKCHRTMSKSIFSRHKNLCIPQGKSIKHYNKTKSSTAQIEKKRKNRVIK